MFFRKIYAFPATFAGKSDCKNTSSMELSPTQPGEAHIEKDSEALHLSFSLLWEPRWHLDAGQLESQDSQYYFHRLKSAPQVFNFDPYPLGPSQCFDALHPPWWIPGVNHQVATGCCVDVLPNSYANLQREKAHGSAKKQKKYIENER